MNRNFGIVAAASAAMLVVGCQGSSSGYKPTPETAPAKATLQAGNEKDLFPLNVGNYWTYTVNGIRSDGIQSGNVPASETKATVTAAEPVADGVQATVVNTTNDKVTDQQIWLVNSKGIYQVGYGTKGAKFSPPQPVVLFPVKPHTTFTWTGTHPGLNGVQVGAKVTNTVLDFQDVDTDNGKYSALPVESVSTETVPGSPPVESRSTIYFSPGVGIVRYITSRPIKDKSGKVFMATDSLKLKFASTSSAKR